MCSSNGWARNVLAGGPFRDVEALLDRARAFYPEIVIAFEVTDPARKYHVPLLLSPYAYSTYRGS